ncbi:hypothetical protein M3Y97_00494000 [Aphelenchoides bicaudatus]|nr:hypothetical protein M3Y97_00494000 [Aphelenchoides bicaudatus]
METTGQNQTFSVRACESDLMHYLNPIGDKIGHKLQVKCQKEGTVEKNVGAFTYFINCCTDSDCDKKDTNSASSAKWIGSILFASLMAFAYNF